VRDTSRPADSSPLAGPARSGTKQRLAAGAVDKLFPGDGTHDGHLGTAAQDGDAGRRWVCGDLVILQGQRGEQALPFRIWAEGGKTHLRLGKAGAVR